MNWPEVRAWRKAARAVLIPARVAVPLALRTEWTGRLADALRPILARVPSPVSFYWPFRAEPDLRPLMRELDSRGIVVALPVAVRLGEPLVFRPWRPGMPMERGIWDIPIPATTEEVVPRTLVAPVVGFDAAGYRLGYGGGFFDRTLAKLGAEARAIGVGFSMFELPTIHPQPHDVAMVRIVTEALPELPESASPVCYADLPEAERGQQPPDAELAEEIRALAGAVPRERRPLLDFVLWKLTGESGTPQPPARPPADPGAQLSRLLSHIGDGAVHMAAAILRDSIGAGG